MSSPPRRNRLLSIVAPLLGAGAIAAALGADLIGVGAGGFGRSQFVLATFGAVMLLGGFRLPALPRLVGPVLAAGAAACATSFGLVHNVDFCAVVGVGAAVAAGLADLGGDRRLFREWLDSKPFQGRKLLLAGLTAGQVLLLGFIARQYHLESQAFSDSVMPIVVAGFLLSCLIPASIRLLYFVFLSFGAFEAVLGLRNMAFLLIPAILILAVCRLPIPFRNRVWILLGIGAVLAVLRAGKGAVVLPGAVWPILGSIFMFRLIVFVYDLSHAKEKPTWTQTLAYFFMLPNVAFPFFPVVDYTMFRRTFKDAPEHRIHQKGMVFLFWGVTHLVLYRAVNAYLLISPEAVKTSGDLLRYLVANFALYLRVSGQFHLIIGILHLFGLDLPRTNNKYFLAGSFTDLWRRINIYWKDFMLKVFYYPILFRFRKLGETRALVLATILVFALTWFFHAYQWFWLRGTFLISGTDAIFWAVLGIFVVVNSLYEARHGRKRDLGTKGFSAADFGRRSLNVAVTFTVMAVLWSLWSSASVSEWLTLMSAIRTPGLTAGLLTTLPFFAVIAAGATAAAPLGRRKPPAENHGRSVALTVAGFLILYIAGNPAVAARAGRGYEKVMRDLRWSRLADRDQVRAERGYYEKLNAVNTFNNQLWELYMRRPVYLEIWETDAVRKTKDFLDNELNPNVSIIFRGAPYVTNRWAMRDHDYEKEAPAGTFRAAFLGDSHTEGWGVGNDETFENLMEERMNREKSFPAYQKIEFLNFAVGGYLPPQEMMAFERKALDFHPQALFFVTHPGDAERVAWHLAKAALNGWKSPYPYFQAMMDRAAITPGMKIQDGVRLLMPESDEGLAWIYQRVGDTCREQGIRPVWIFLPSVPGKDEPEEYQKMSAMAAAAGFEVINISDVYDGHELDTVRIAEWDQHPSVLGHQLIAERLYQEFRKRPEIFAPAAPR